ncbi:MAG TPA: glycogen/starch/alpha-glucan phosphorylase [Kofleriaceae bacterium]|nr:glycogen/starch/alpha-glucan phosphorylase [Kofleriaceae bacterium]
MDYPTQPSRESGDSRHQGLAPEASSVVVVEDDRTGMDPVTVERAVLDHLRFTRMKDLTTATQLDVYHAMAHAVRDRLVERWIQTQRAYYEHKVKRIYYLSAEYLIGRMLANNLISLGLYEQARAGLREYGIDLTDLLEEESDPGLGNGGLGRLAACFLDSMATLQLPGYGYGIRYEFGIFDQAIENGWQVERGDNWLRFGNPWEVERHEYTVPVHFGGRVEERPGAGNRYEVLWVPNETVLGLPFDTPIAGYGNNTVNNLRLWSARATRQFNFAVFNDGDYRRAVEDKAIGESISKVLYPNDESEVGKELRLRQQYFFTCCSIHDIVRRFKKQESTFDSFPDRVAIQLNDTHPAVAVAELMRVLVDVEHVPWDRAWEITQSTIAFTNHTLLPEALEVWSASLFGRLLPRHLTIIFEINQRFLRQVQIHWPNDEARRRRMSIIGEEPHKHVRMAHLAVVGSHSVNGVAELHSELLRKQLMADFAELWPERFNNKTNGVTPRRWLLECNPRLAGAITRRIGPGWATHLDRLAELAPLADDAGFRVEVRDIKAQNKRELAEVIWQRNQVRVDPESIFDVQVKRLHEYKRQLLNCLHIVSLYQSLKRDPRQPFPGRTFILGGKAAPGYRIAKLHIKLINSIAETVNMDPDLAGRLKVVYLANYSVSLGEKIFPASDVSEQISLAGKEASGTGNMKFAMNGALTIGTLDGANIEIREAVGEDNFFLFGLRTDQVAALRAEGYQPGRYIERIRPLREAIDLIASGFFTPGDPSCFQPIVDDLWKRDQYMVCADFEDYAAMQERVGAVYGDPEDWTRRVIANLAGVGRFSSDRTIAEYNRDIWHAQPVAIDLVPAQRRYP